MEYIRVKMRHEDEEATGGWIMRENEFNDWLLEVPMWQRIADGYSFSFSKVKKSPLLNSKNQK